MKPGTLAVSFAIILFTQSVQAQKGDWSAVERLRPGTPISVKFRSRARCIFESATDDYLVCERLPRGPIWFGPSELKFSRRIIHEVRLEHSDCANAAVGTAVGAGVGFAVGTGLPSRGGSRLVSGGFLGILFGAIGHAFGSDFPISHGAVIYKH